MKYVLTIDAITAITNVYYVPFLVESTGMGILLCIVYLVANVLLLTNYSLWQNKFLEIALAVLLSLVVQLCQTNSKRMQC